MGANNLWKFNQKSVSKAIALGAACGWIPLPFHTVIAIFFAVLLDCNIPLVAISIWLANPLTMPFMYYFAYELGLHLLNIAPSSANFHINFADMLLILEHIWEPFLLGCLVAGSIFAILFYCLINLIWPLIIIVFKRKNKLL